MSEAGFGAIWSGFEKLACPSCHSDIKSNCRACPMCGFKFRGTIGSEYDADWKSVFDLSLKNMPDVDHGKLAERLYDNLKSRSDISETELDAFVNKILDSKEDLIERVHDPDADSKTEKVLLALAGVNPDITTEDGAEKVVECKVCESEFKITQTQKHHVSYLHDFTIRVCYSCHRRIHHEDGYYDELQPDISRKEAKKLKDTGYTGSDS